jgi:hypothetical protein
MYTYQEIDKKTYHLRFCSSVELKCCFGGIYCLHLHVRRVNQERNKQKQAAYPAASAGFLLSLRFGPKCESDEFMRKIYLSLYYVDLSFETKLIYFTKNN